MSHFIHGILSNILILPLLHTLLILKELMFDVCVGAGRCTCVWTNESGSQRTNSGTTQFFFSSWDWIFHWLEIQQVDQASVCQHPEICLCPLPQQSASVLHPAWHLFMWVLGINITQGQVLERDAGTDLAISPTELILSISSEMYFIFEILFIFSNYKHILINMSQFNFCLHVEFSPFSVLMLVQEIILLFY